VYIVVVNICPGTSSKYIFEDGLGVTIRNVSLQDGGLYTCRAEVDADGRYDERKITVNVHGQLCEGYLHVNF